MPKQFVASKLGWRNYVMGTHAGFNGEVRFVVYRHSTHYSLIVERVDTLAICEVHTGAEKYILRLFDSL